MRRQAFDAVITILASAWANAQFTQQGSKLVGTGAAGAARQGTSVAISADGTTAIVGGKGDNSEAGAAWVFTASTFSVWMPEVAHNPGFKQS